MRKGREVQQRGEREPRAHGGARPEERKEQTVNFIQLPYGAV